MTFGTNNGLSNGSTIVCCTNPSLQLLRAPLVAICITTDCSIRGYQTIFKDTVKHLPNMNYAGITLLPIIPYTMLNFSHANYKKSNKGNP